MVAITETPLSEFPSFTIQTGGGTGGSPLTAGYSAAPPPNMEILPQGQAAPAAPLNVQNLPLEAVPQGTLSSGPSFMGKQLSPSEFQAILKQIANTRPGATAAPPSEAAKPPIQDHAIKGATEVKPPNIAEGGASAGLIRLLSYLTGGAAGGGLAGAVLPTTSLNSGEDARVKQLHKEFPGVAAHEAPAAASAPSGPASTLDRKEAGKMVPAGSMPFGQAFHAARMQGLKEFTWKGKRYTTQLRAAPAAAAHAAPIHPAAPAMSMPQATAGATPAAPAAPNMTPADWAKLTYQGQG